MGRSVPFPRASRFGQRGERQQTCKCYRDFINFTFSRSPPSSPHHLSKDRAEMEKIQRSPTNSINNP